jgi:HEAT repeat protein
MRKHFCVTLIFVMMLILGGIGCVAEYSRKPDPIYQGKPLSSWFEDYHPLVNGQESSSNIGSPERKKAKEVVRDAGTNVVPVLLRMFQSTNFYRGAQAVEAFRDLDSAVQAAAMPGLIEVYDRSISETSHNYEFVIEVWSFCMGSTATNAIPSLLRGVTNANNSVRSQSIMALGRIHAEPELVVPQLTKSLSDPDKTVRWVAAAYLGDFGADAKQAMPTLFESLTDTDQFVREAATNSVKKIDPEAAAKAGVE